VDNLDDAGGDVLDALNALNFADLQLQAKGWHWNTEEALLLNRTTENLLPLPDQTLSVKRAYWDTGAFSNDLVQRGKQLYDRANRTFVFRQNVIVDIVARVSWDLLPEAARQYITLHATRRFQAAKQGATVIAQVNQADLTEALTTLEQQEDEAAPNNQITGNLQVQRSLRGDGVRRRNESGAPWQPSMQSEQADESGSPDPGLGGDIVDFVSLINNIVD
jgi:hypothetical protein